MNMSHRGFRGLAMALVIALAGCGQFGLNVAPEVSSTKVVTQAGFGNLEIQIAPASIYRVLATVADVATIRVRLTGDKLPTPIIRDVDPDPLKNNLAGKKGRITFESLPAGQVTVNIEARNAQGAPIGFVERDVNVIAGESRREAFVLNLNNTVVANPNGNLPVNIIIQDGPTHVPSIAPASPDPGYPELDGRTTLSGMAPFGDDPITWSPYVFVDGVKTVVWHASIKPGTPISWTTWTQVNREGIHDVKHYMVQIKWTSFSGNHHEETRSVAQCLATETRSVSTVYNEFSPCVSQCY